MWQKYGGVFGGANKFFKIMFKLILKTIDGDDGFNLKL